MINKLRQKFILIAMLSTFAVLFVIVGTINVINFISVNRSLDNRLDLIADNGGSFPDLMGERPPKPDEDLPKKLAISGNEKEALFKKPGINKESQFITRYFTVKLSENGEIIDVNVGKVAALTESEASDYARKVAVKNNESGFEGDYKYLRVRCSEKTDMYVFLDCRMEIDTVKSFLLSSVGISILGLVGVFILVWFFSGRILRPVMESYEKQKRFITDASHEIKTPLTIIDANTEVIEMTSGENEWTHSIRKQIKRLTSLTEKMVFLAKLDESENRLEMAEFSLSDAVLDTAEIFKVLAIQKNKQMEIDVAEGINYVGDEKSIRQLISILLDNAVKYSGSTSKQQNAEIKLTLTCSGKTRRLKVWNTVSDISMGKHDELFERFLRLDKSRNSRTGGFGIGLSVAYAIVNAHNGKITAESRDGKSLEFEILL